jgi:hypothetical protein
MCVLSGIWNGCYDKSTCQTCYDLSSLNAQTSCDPQVLGGCKYKCAEMAQGGQIILTYDNCDGSWANGCEANLNDISNCGKCGYSCSSIVSATNVSCSFQNCRNISNNGGTQTITLDCNKNPIDGFEINGSADNNNCGHCGNKCTQNFTCQNGFCLP